MSYVIMPGNGTCRTIATLFQSQDTAAGRIMENDKRVRPWGRACVASTSCWGCVPVIGICGRDDEGGGDWAITQAGRENARPRQAWERLTMC